VAVHRLRSETRKSNFISVLIATWRDDMEKTLRSNVEARTTPHVSRKTLTPLIKN
jgi:hypothetical protein